MKMALVFLFATFLPTQAEWSTMQSVWNQSKEEANSFEGVIKTIYVDEENDRIMVRVKPNEENKSLKEFVICEDNIQSARNNHTETDKMNLVRNAFNTGMPVRLGFGGPFDRCLSSIKYLKTDSAPQQVGI